LEEKLLIVSEEFGTIKECFCTTLHLLCSKQGLEENEKTSKNQQTRGKNQNK
jgi:hypothetical protein